MINVDYSGLLEQIARDEQTLRMQPVAAPGEAFYRERVRAYREEVLRLRAQGESAPTAVSDNEGDGQAMNIKELLQEVLDVWRECWCKKSVPFLDYTCPACETRQKVREELERR